MPEVAQLDRLAEGVARKMSLADLNAEDERRSKRMEYLFEKGGEHYDLTDDEAREIKALNDEIADLAKAREQHGEFQRLQEANQRRIQEQRTVKGDFTHAGPRVEATATPAEQKTLGQLFTEHPTYLAGKGVTQPRFAVAWDDIDVKTVMSLTAGFSQQQAARSRVVDFALRRPVVADLIPQDNTTDNAIVYMEETTFTNAADTVAEGGTKQESALAWTQRTQPVEVIATLLPVTNQQLDDVPGIRGIVNNRLTTMLQLAEEDQLLNGNGTTPDLMGFYNKPSVQTQAKGTDPVPDAVYKAMTKVRFTGFADVTGIVAHPNDWQDVRLLRTASGEYIWGSPADVGVERMWGVPVIVTTAATENTMLLGDFRLYSHISRRMGLRIDASTEHSTFFALNQTMLRAEERLSLEIYRAAAFCYVTGV